MEAWARGHDHHRLIIDCPGQVIRACGAGQALAEFPEVPVDLDRSPMDAAPVEGAPDHLNCPYRRGADLDLARASGRQQPALVDGPGKGFGIDQHAELAEDLRDLVVGEGGEVVEVTQI